MISQREARRNLKELRRLREVIAAQRRIWSQDYIGATNIATCNWDSENKVPVAIRTARKLKHAVVCIGDDTGQVRFMALPHPSEPV